MNKRGESVVSAMLAVALAMVMGSVALAATGSGGYAAYVMGLACFAMACAIYLEVYSRRG